MDRIILTPEQTEYLIQHFKNTRNEELADNLGISIRSVNRFAVTLGLTKTKAFMKRMQAEAAAAAHYFNRKRGTYPPKGFQIPNSEQYRFKPGEHRLTKRQERERIRKSADARKVTVAKERARLKAGLKPMTRMKLRLTDTGRDARTRYYLRKLGYRCSEDMYTMVYDASTRRSRKWERNPGPFRFIEA